LRGVSRFLAATCLALLLPGCGDSVVGVPVPDEPGEATLADFRTGPLVEPSAFSWIVLSTVRTDQSGQWDFAFALEADGMAQLFPRASVLEQPSTAGLQIVPESFEGLTRAPESGYITDEPVPVQVGDVLAAVSRRQCGSLGFVRFGKLEILDIDLVRGRLTFKQLANPNCENPNLVPGEAGEV
jgi:hypothetical protein